MKNLLQRIKQRMAEGICRSVAHKQTDPYRIIQSKWLRESMKQFILREIITRNQGKYFVKDGLHFKYCVDLTEYGGIAFYFQLESVFSSHFAVADRFLEKGDLVFDIGANLGIFSLYCASRGMTVTAFEPEQLNYSICNFNKAVNGYDNITFHQSCVGATDGYIDLYLNHYNNGTHSTIKEEILADMAEYVPESNHETHLDVQHTPIKKIDSLPEANRDIKLMKIDTEGNELDVLKGATKTFEQNPPEIIMVEDRGGVERHKDKCQAYNEFLQRYNYRILFFGKNGLTENRLDRDNMSDVLFVHERNQISEF